MFLNDVEHEHSIATRQRENEYAKNDWKTLVFVFADNWFLCSLVYASVAQAAEILREAVPLERNHVALHLERYIEQDGQSKNQSCSYMA